MTNTEIDWAALARPFDPSEVSFRLQGNPREGKTSAVVVAYLDSRNVQQRLDEVVGPEDWSFDWQPIVTNNSAVLVAKGTLTIAGVSKSDVGDAGQTEPSKASVSDSLKRAAVLFGIGRYLYDLPTMYAECEKHGAGWYMARGEEDRLRAKYLQPARPASPPARRDAPSVSTDASSRPQATPAASSGQTTQDTSTVDPLALTHASALDQKRLSGQLAARFLAAEAQANFLHSVTGRDVDPAKVRDGKSDLSVPELARLNERLTRITANGNGGGRH